MSNISGSAATSLLQPLSPPVWRLLIRFLLRLWFLLQLCIPVLCWLCCALPDFRGSRVLPTGRWWASRSPSRSPSVGSRQCLWVAQCPYGHLPWTLPSFRWHPLFIGGGTRRPGLRWRCVPQYRGHLSHFQSRDATPCGRRRKKLWDGGAFCCPPPACSNPENQPQIWLCWTTVGRCYRSPACWIMAPNRLQHTQLRHQFSSRGPQWGWWGRMPLVSACRSQSSLHWQWRRISRTGGQ